MAHARLQIVRKADVQPVVDGYEEDLGYMQVTVTAVAQTLDALITAADATKSLATFDDSGGAPPKKVLIVAENGNIRFRGDGTAPTASVGYPIASGTEFTWSSEMSELKLIRNGGSDVTVSLLFLG